MHRVSSFGYKLSFTFLAYGLLLTLIALFSIFQIQNETFEKSSIENAKIKFFERKNYFDTYIRSSRLLLYSINNSKIFKEYLNSHNRTSSIELFKNLSESSDHIMQLRFIDIYGMEKIRINRDDISLKPYVVDYELLQNKSKRYYFKDILALKKNEIWYSKLDLNMENNLIQKPIKPVIRVGMPVFYQDKKVGILIVNLFTKDFLHSLISDTTYNMYLIDKDAYIIVEPNHKLCWSRYLKDTKNVKIDSINPLFSSAIKTEEHISKNYYSNILGLENGEQLRLIIEPKSIYIQKNIQDNLFLLLWIMLGIILLSIPFAWLFAKIPARLKEEVDELNETLEQKISEKTNELQDLNKNLELKVEYEVEKNRQKDIVLLEQSRHSALVDMLSNIAHHWRQPLSVISTIATGLRLKVDFGDKVENDDIIKAVDEIFDTTQNLSGTINSFRNFFNDDDSSCDFSLKTVINDCYLILKGDLDTNNIKINMDLPNDIIIHGMQEKLCTAIIQILYNAKDSIIKNNIEIGYIDIKVATNNSDIIIEICDNGNGVDDSIKDQIFDPYFTTKHQSYSTGIGLYMAKELIFKYYNGELTFKNITMTKDGIEYLGACFKITLKPN